MMFRQMKNIDSAFRHIRLFSVIFLVSCVVCSVFIVFKSHQLVERSNQRIFILANGKALEAYSAERKDNIPVEAKDHIKMFHYYFFTLDPDDKVIQLNLSKALYHADASAKQQYDNLKENGYYSNLIAGNVSQEIEEDTIYLNTNQYPFYFRYTGYQKITRLSTIVTRNIVTEGYLRNVSRSDNNPHGFLLEKWRILENKDIKIEKR